jgi:sugar-phosphatase
VRRVAAVLFDLDGVLVESREATERVWLEWAARNGIDEEELRSAMHGVRSVEVVRALRPGLDAVAESDAIERAQAEDLLGLRAIPGAAQALGALREDRVAVVTSATRALAAARLGAVGIEPPAVMVNAEDVSRGKPDPEGYLTAARRLGVEPAGALVVEDSPPGIEAGRAAGAATVGVTSTHASAALAAADVVIQSLVELPAVLARDFDAAAVLRANEGHGGDASGA